MANPYSYTDKTSWPAYKERLDYQDFQELVDNEAYNKWGPVFGGSPTIATNNKLYFGAVDGVDYIMFDGTDIGFWCQGTQTLSVTDGGAVKILSDISDGTNAATVSELITPKYIVGNTSALGGLPNEILSQNINPTNNLLNGNFEVWYAGTAVAPTEYVVSGSGAAVAREGTIVKLGTYSARLTRDLNNCILYQYIHTDKGIDYWKSRVLTVGCWVYATQANAGLITIYDGVGATSSSLHDGDSTWQLLTVTKVIDASATELRIDLGVNSYNTAVYFDGAMAVEGYAPFAFEDSPRDYREGLTHTRYYTVGAAAFKDAAHDAPSMINTGALFYNDESGYNSRNYIAEVTLPHGATVTNFNCYYYREDAAASIVMSLLNSDGTGGATTMATVTGAGTGGNANTADSSITDATIDNSAKHYYAYLTIDNNDSETDTKFYHAIITYTITAPLP